MAQQKNTGQKIGVAEKRHQALILRKSGATFDQIGQQLKCTRQNAFKLVTEALKQINEQVTSEAIELKTMELERLDMLWFTAYKMAILGNLGAIDRCIKIHEKRVALCGLTDIPMSKAEKELAARVDFSKFTDDELKKFINDRLPSVTAGTGD